MFPEYENKIYIGKNIFRNHAPNLLFETFIIKVGLKCVVETVCYQLELNLQV